MLEDEGGVRGDVHLKKAQSNSGVPFSQRLVVEFPNRLDHHALRAGRITKPRDQRVVGITPDAARPRPDHEASGGDVDEEEQNVDANTDDCFDRGAG